VEFVSNVYRVDNQMVIQCNVRDITERKQMENELAQARENQFRTLIESLPQKIFLKDMNSVYISCNTNYANDLKIKPGRSWAKQIMIFSRRNWQKDTGADDKRIMESGKTESHEEEYHIIRDYRAGSGKAFINIVRAPVWDSAGKIKGLFGLFGYYEQKILETERNRVGLWHPPQRQNQVRHDGFSRTQKPAGDRQRSSGRCFGWFDWAINDEQKISWVREKEHRSVRSLDQ